MPDLITAEFAEQALAAGGIAPSDGQAAHLAAAIAAASGAIRRWCGDRVFTRATFDEVLDVEHDGTVLLRQIPVNAVLRVAADAEDALTIRNVDATTNQRATVRFATTGDFETGLTVTGLLLTRVASGVASSSTLAFADHATLSALAAAVDALGGGWSAELEGGYGPWPSTELVSDRVAAIGALEGASLRVWAEDLDDADLDRRTGILALPGRRRGRVRVVYDAGFDAVPMPVQEACAEAVADMLNTLAIDQRVSSETAGAYSYVLNTAFADYHLTKGVLGKIAPYRLHQA